MEIRSFEPVGASRHDPWISRQAHHRVAPNQVPEFIDDRKLIAGVTMPEPARISITKARSSAGYGGPEISIR
jgi:hypothetical protein